MIRAIGSLSLAVYLASGAFGQSTPPPPSFDVASVKLAVNQDLLESRPNRSVGRFRWTTQLAYLVSYAYDMPWARISGDTSGWGAIYEVDATSNPKATEAEVRLMLQSLLLDRFKMVVHRVTKDADGYALLVAKGGPKMQAAKEGEMPALPEWMRGPAADPAGMEGLVVGTMPERAVGSITGRRVTMLQLTETLQRMLNTAVVDQTGLSGKYYFGFRYAKEDDPDIPYPSLAGAIAELGLKLEKYKGPVEMLVIDHTERPSDN